MIRVDEAEDRSGARARRSRTGRGAVVWTAAGAVLALSLGCGAQRQEPRGAASRATPSDLVVRVAPPSGFDSGERATVDGSIGVGSATERAELTVSRTSDRIDVKLAGKARLLGMRRFSLRRPDDLSFPETAAIHAQLRREGLVVPRTRMVRARVNGEAGVRRIAIESPSKEMLESQRRREGVLFRLKKGALPVARVDVYRARKVASEERLADERDTATGLLQAFLRRELGADHVFDVELMARYLAVAEVWQADALVAPAELRFYFNPITQRLEPVAVDERLRSVAAPSDRLVTAGAWPAQLLADDALRRVFERELARIAAAPADLGVWRERARALPARVAQTETRFGAGLRAEPGVASVSANPIPRATVEQVLEHHRYLAWDESNRSFTARSGRWQVGGSLVLPEGAGLVLPPGTTLLFPPGGLLIASGPLHFRGRSGDPVVLAGTEPASGPSRWGGAVVLRSDRPHEWRHVEVRDTTGVDRGGWRLTGGVTFRKSVVVLQSSSFSGNRAEDALNLIRSRFAFRDVSFRGLSSDGFDCDFCEGRLVGGSFREIGGDGLDVSGSRVEADGVTFEEIRDKAISVGEGSKLVARNVNIDTVGTAVASKDGSELVFENSRVSNASHAAIMAYVKKREYGPARVRAENIEMSGVARSSVVQHGSRIEIDGVEQAAEEVDVEGLYEHGPMAK
ncbi:MAG: right-handed parallel beta-helix repeat-containing protein [Myxococcota bacterium]